MRKTTLALAIAVAALGANAALAFEEGDWLVRTGITNVDPKSDNHPVVQADAGAGLSLNATYLFTENWAVDILAAIPFNHDIELLDGTRVGDTDQLPPTVTLQYHFRPDSGFQPYIGAGVNYTVFFSEGTTGPLAGSELDLDDSYGLSAQLGFDYMINDHWFVNFDARWMDIDTDASLDGEDLGTVEIDPMTYGLSLGYRF